MNDLAHEDLLETLTQLAHEQEPSPLPPSTRERLLSRALESKSNEPTRFPSRRRQFAALAAAIMVLGMFAFGGLAVQSPSTQVAPAEPLRLTLPTGDRIAATTGADFALESATPQNRQVRITDGSILFEVAPLNAEEHFVVHTPHFQVSVRGTVFSVQVTSAGSRLDVYEGEVEVSHDGRSQHVSEHGAFDSRTGSGFVAEDSPFFTEGRAARERRQEERQTAETRWLSANRSEAERPADPAEPASMENVATPPARESSDSIVPTQPRPAERSETELTSADLGPGTATTISIAEVANLIVTGNASQALAICEERFAQTGDAAWNLTKADALRALGRSREAVLAYEAAMLDLDPIRARLAGYLAASIRLRSLDDAAGGLGTLDRSQATLPGPLRERALALRVQLLVQMRRNQEAAGEAERYLAEFAGSSLDAWMQDVRDSTR